jgi:uncharacterized protein (TIGR01615 family)
MARAVIRVPRVDTQGGSNNGNAKQRSSLTSPKALGRHTEMQDKHDTKFGNGMGNPVAFDLPMDKKQTDVHHGPSCQSGFNKVPSLMFDMEDTQDDTELQRMNGRYEDSMPSQASFDRLMRLVEPQDEDEEMLAIHVNYALNDALERCGGDMDTTELGERLRTLGYTVTLRTALGGDSIGGSASCLRNLRHSFLAVTLPNSSDSTSSGAEKVFIVDPKFLDQFEIAHSTSRYDAILSVLPSAIVLAAGRLADTVGVLCEEMARAFEKTGTPLPPWRQANAMLSKWQPRRSEDVAMTYQRRTPVVVAERGTHKDGKKATQLPKEGFVTVPMAIRQDSGNLNGSHHDPSRRTTPDQADMEAFYSSDDMGIDGKAIWPGYQIRDSNNLVSEYVSLSV